MSAPAPNRIRTLDLIRGIAVLGILAVNIASFAAPTGAGYSPNLPQPGSPADNWAFAVNLVVFEGKMRALFSILFGASLVLFVERKDAAGQDGAAIQVRRLGWLALFGLLHFALLWDGDILFLYACVGIGALAIRRTPPPQLAVIALLLFSVWQAAGIINWAPSVLREGQVAAGSASPAEAKTHSDIIADRRAEDRIDSAANLLPLAGQIAARMDRHPTYPFAVLATYWGETLSYMLIGMALLQSGFFAGEWPRRQVKAMALGGVGTGLALTLAFAWWAGSRGWPELAMHLAVSYGLSFAHLLTALGYGALLVLAAPRILATRPGQRLEAAGRMAFSNYLGTTAVMCAIFSGWGLGLFGQYGAARQWLFVAGAWAMMLIWSPWWLARFRQGPLEWAWRSLTEWRRLPLRR